jgi:SAM-dependent methyltransferase
MFARLKDSVARHIIQNAVIGVPGAATFVRRFHRTGLGRAPEKIEPVLAEFLRGTGAVEGRVVAELGPGQTPDILFAAVLYGARRAVGLDVNTYLDAASARALATYQPTRDWIARAVERGVLPRQRGLDLTRYAGAAVLPSDVLDLHVYDGRVFPLERESVDVIWSKSVLEHVREPGAVAREMFRVLKPGGVMCHIIDLRDHYQLAPGENWLRFLEYPGSLWNLMSSRRSSWANRLRAADWDRLFADAGFREVHKQTDRHALPVGFNVDRLTPLFRDMRPEDLQVAWYHVVLTKD